MDWDCQFSFDSEYHGPDLPERTVDLPSGWRATLSANMNTNRIVFACAENLAAPPGDDTQTTIQGEVEDLLAALGLELLTARCGFRFAGPLKYGGGSARTADETRTLAATPSFKINVHRQPPPETLRDNAAPTPHHTTETRANPRLHPHPDPSRMRT